MHAPLQDHASSGLHELRAWLHSPAADWFCDRATECLLPTSEAIELAQDYGVSLTTLARELAQVTA